MPTSLFHDNIAATSEQNLIEDLVMEAIMIHGVDMYYMPREQYNEDPIYGEDPGARFSKAFSIEMYVKTYDGFQGQGDIFSKMGYEIKDELTITVSRRRFEQEIGSPTGLIRPREGDLVYLPLNKAIFEIKFVEHEANFYQVGGLYFYELTCHKFEYSSEVIDTDVTDIDHQANAQSMDLLSIAPALGTEDGLYKIATESGVIIYPNTPAEIESIQGQNKEFEEQAHSGVLDFSETNPFGDV